MKIKISVNGVIHSGECTYSGLTAETVNRFNKTLAEAKIKQIKGGNEKC